MRIPTAIIIPVSTVFLFACDQQHAVPEIDPGLGIQCFESHRASLPPGTQYEGIKNLTDNRLTIKVMNGVEVVTIDCAVEPDRAMQNDGE